MKSLQHISTQAIVTTLMLFTVFAPFTALQAQAQVSCPPGQASDGTCIASGTTTAAPAAQATNPTTNTNGNINTGTPSTSGTTVAPGDNSGTGGSVVSTSNLFANCSLNNISGCITAIVYAFTIGLGSVIAYLAANLFDTAVQLSLNSAAYSLDFVSVGWTTARDLANMGFLFILIYIAFTVIFKAETSNTMTTLALVIVVALLVNFSFFFSRLAIDAGNILSIEFYNSIPAPPVSQSPVQNIPGVATAISYLGPNANEKDLTASIMNMLQIQNLLNNQSFSSTNNSGSIIATIFIYIAGAVILWLLTVTFATNAVKFLFRIVVLWLLIIASPLAFIAAAVQGFGGNGYFKRWRDMLIANAMYPAAFMFIFLLLTNFANEAASNSNLLGNVFTQLQQQGNSWGAIIGAVSSIGIRLALVVGLMMVGMRVSDNISVAGASAAEKFGSWAGGKFIGAYGAVGRNTLGWAAYRASQNERFQTAAANNSFARGLWRSTNSIAKSSFDARAPLKAAGAKDVYGLNLKGANKGGYKGAFDARIKATEAEAKEFSTLTDTQKAEAKAAAEAKRQGDKAVIATQIVSATAQRDEADRLRKEAEAKVKEAKDKEDVVTEKENAAKKEVEKANQLIQDHRDNGKVGTPDMVAAQKQRDDAQAEVVKFQKDKAPHTADRKAAEAEVSTHTTSRQIFSDKIQKLQQENKAITEEVKKDTKEEEKNRTLKNVYAGSISKRGLGNVSRFGIYIPKADKKAAEKIRKEKSSKDKIADAVKDLEKEENGDKEEKKDEPAAEEKKGDKKDDGH